MGISRLVLFGIIENKFPKMNKTFTVSSIICNEGFSFQV